MELCLGYSEGALEILLNFESSITQLSFWIDRILSGACIRSRQIPDGLLRGSLLRDGASSEACRTHVLPATGPRKWKTRKPASVKFDQ